MQTGLSGLPAEALARVCANLGRRERRELSWTCRSLREALSSGTVWQDVYRVKYGGYVGIGDAEAMVKMYEAGGEMLCYNGAWRQYVGTEKALVATDGEEIYVGSGEWMGTWGGKRVCTGKRINAVAAGCGMSVVAMDKFLMPYVNGALGKALRGHVRTVRCVEVLSEVAVASGADNGAVRVHATRGRRSHVLLRGHAGAVVSVSKFGHERLVSRAGERVKVWDVRAERCMRSINGASYAVDEADGETLYVASPSCIRVHDMRAPGVPAVLSLPIRWGRAKLGPISVSRGTVVGGVGSGGIAHWPATGRWEAIGRGWPGRWGHQNVLLAITLRADSCIAGGHQGELLAVDLCSSAETIAPHPGYGGGAIYSLLNAGHRFVVRRQRDAVLFDSTDAEFDVELAQRAAGLSDEDAPAYGHHSAQGRFWAHVDHSGNEESRIGY